MNPTNPVAPAAPLRVPGGTGERRRRNQDADAFRRALHERDGAAHGRDAVPEPPAPPPLQLRPPTSRTDRDPDAPIRHVDVVA